MEQFKQLLPLELISHLYIVVLILQFVAEAAEVGVDVREAVILSQGEQDASRAAAVARTTETTVADATTRRTPPLWIEQGLLDILSVSVPQTRPAELTLNPPTLLAAAARLGVDSFLTALMTGGACDSVVDFIGHVVRNQLNLVLGDVLHRTDKMRFAQSRSRWATALWSSPYLQQLLLQAELQLFVLRAERIIDSPHRAGLSTRRPLRVPPGLSSGAWWTRAFLFRLLLACLFFQ